jgi:hypothetical protein
MFEIKQSSTWNHVSSNLTPTANLTPKEVQQIKDRDDLIDLMINYNDIGTVWVKLNSGINRGSIFPASTDVSSNHDGWTAHMMVDPQNKKRMTSGSGGPTVSSLVNYRKFDKTKNWDWAARAAHVQHRTGSKKISFQEGTLYPEFMGSEITNTASVLLGYQGGKVYCHNEKIRPLTFTDRLDQEVTIGDLVVVALNYGAGLDICMVRGFADAKRVIIESVDTGEADRINLEDNETNKIMKMPNSLRDTAMMLKLAR